MPRGMTILRQNQEKFHVRRLQQPISSSRRGFGAMGSNSLMLDSYNNPCEVLIKEGQ